MVQQTYSGFDITKIGEYWQEGANILDQSAIGKLITAPVDLLNTAVTSTEQTVANVPKIANTLPWILLILAGGVAAYLVFAGKKGTKLIPGF